MTVEELRIFINAIANRDQTGNSVTPDEYNSYLARANEDKFRIETGIREVQTPIYFQNSQLSTDALAPFIERGFSITGTSGVFILPSNYRHAISMFYIDGTGRSRTITALNIDEYDAIQGNPVKPPTAEYPYATQYGNLINVSPATIAVIRLSYLRKPAVPKWGYITSQDEPVYDPLTSVQMEWNEEYQIDVARIILGYMGINFQDAFLYQAIEAQKAKGS